MLPSDRHCGSWAGLRPGNHESPGKPKSGKPRKGNKWLRAILAEAARAASRIKDYLGAQYQRLARRRGKKKAAGAVAHRLLVIAYHILKDGTTRTAPPIGTRGRTAWTSATPSSSSGASSAARNSSHCGSPSNRSPRLPRWTAERFIFRHRANSTSSAPPRDSSVCRCPPGCLSEPRSAATGSCPGPGGIGETGDHVHPAGQRLRGYHRPGARPSTGRGECPHQVHRQPNQLAATYCPVLRRFPPGAHSSCMQAKLRHRLRVHPAEGLPDPMTRLRARPSTRWS